MFLSRLHGHLNAMVVKSALGNFVKWPTGWPGLSLRIWGSEVRTSSGAQVGTKPGTPEGCGSIRALVRLRQAPVRRADGGPRLSTASPCQTSNDSVRQEACHIQ